MRFKLAFILLITVSLSIVTTPASARNSAQDIKYNKIRSLAPNINPKALKLALTAYYHARANGLDRKEILTVVDFTHPSSEERLWVFDLKNDQLLFRTYVTHGKYTGSLYARHFSNRPGSEESSIGLFLTENPYYGHVGYAMRLAGLEPGINNNAERRAIVVHGAQYADAHYVAKYGRLGRSWGCFAVAAQEVHEIISVIKDGTLIFAYYPDQYWLSHSRFLS
ncbi:MAG: murein L,D-transpeptidase catalytic domain family protein [Gammaproteobacteria bacterium]